MREVFIAPRYTQSRRGIAQKDTAFGGSGRAVVVATRERETYRGCEG